MAFFHFPNFSMNYFGGICVHACLAQSGHCVGKWGILDIVDKGVNSKIRSLLEYQGFLGKGFDEAWYLPKWIT